MKIKNKRGSTWIWILIILLLIVVGIGIYFLLSSGGGVIPQPPALPE
ncbi:MAG: PLDc N-terminal domain-containing protein [Nanoarchaeota archaeon]|nr:PLDc N-terminal domain-containing protein [Nanoarchaeota archaeon]MBU1103536.1 PLDc N-terminal domain-containing protein [Nanoarchaeota archaeon]